MTAFYGSLIGAAWQVVINDDESGMSCFVRGSGGRWRLNRRRWLIQMLLVRTCHHLLRVFRAVSGV